MNRDTLHRGIIIVCTLVQIGLAAFMLDRLSGAEGWSAVWAEDSRGYLLAADFFLDRDIAPADAALQRYRLFSPAVPLLAALAGRLAGVVSAFVTLNVLLWLGTALVLYELAKTLSRNSATGLAAALIMTTSLPVIEWGLPVMVDMAAYFMATVVLACLVGPDAKHPNAVRLALLLSAAILVKPTLAFLLLFVTAACIYERRPLKAAGIFFMTAAACLCVYALLGLSTADFLSYGAPRHRGVFYFFSAAFCCFHWGWLFVYAGRRQLKHRFQRTLCYLYLASWLIFYLPFVHNPRLFFVCFPAVISLAAAGLQAGGASRTKMSALIILYALTSNILAALHLTGMRTLGIRDLDLLVEFAGKYLNTASF